MKYFYHQLMDPTTDLLQCPVAVVPDLRQLWRLTRGIQNIRTYFTKHDFLFSKWVFPEGNHPKHMSCTPEGRRQVHGNPSLPGGLLNMYFIRYLHHDATLTFSLWPSGWISFKRVSSAAFIRVTVVRYIFTEPVLHVWVLFPHLHHPKRKQRAQ